MNVYWAKRADVSPALSFEIILSYSEGRSCTNDIPVFNRSLESRKLIGIITKKHRARFLLIAVASMHVFICAFVEVVREH
jgi:hypothetical protein